MAARTGASGASIKGGSQAVPDFLFLVTPTKTRVIALDRCLLPDCLLLTLPAPRLLPLAHSQPEPGKKVRRHHPRGVAEQRKDRRTEIFIDVIHDSLVLL